MAAIISIVPYQPAWPEEFQSIAGSMRQALGDLAVRIDHIGSTSVPGLAAKDRIDIQITVASLSPDVEQALESIGYLRSKRISQDHIPPGGPDRIDEWAKWFFNPPDSQRPTNVHVRILGNTNQRYALLFRDYLRANPAAAEAYARVKIALAKYHGDDIDAYLAVKDPVCDIIMNSAELWAGTTGWELSPDG